MSDQIVFTNVFYEDEYQTYNSTIRTLYIALKEYLGNTFFRGDQKRVLYSSNAYALRKRYSEGTNQVLDLPFMNFRLTSVSNDTLRPWKNSTVRTLGIYIDEIKQKIVMVPVTFSYEGSLWYHTDKDNIYAAGLLLRANRDETIIRPLIIVNTVEIPYYALVSFNINFEPQYTEVDWLTQNKIHSIGITIDVQTFLFDDNTDVSIPESVLLEFSHNNDLNMDNPDEILTFVIDQVNGTVNTGF